MHDQRGGICVFWSSISSFETWIRHFCLSDFQEDTNVLLKVLPSECKEKLFIAFHLVVQISCYNLVRCFSNTVNEISSASILNSSPTREEAESLYC